jgi:hypothetical protein
MTSQVIDASFIPGQLTFPAAFSSPSPPPLPGGNAWGAADVQIEAIPDSTGPDSTGKQAIPVALLI